MNLSIPFAVSSDLLSLGPVLAAALVLVFVLVFIATRFRRCPSNRVLVIYGKVGKNKSARCIHGGGAFVIPLIQESAFLDLAPLTLEIDLVGALSKKNIRVNVPSTFTVGISTRGEIMQNAAERLLGLSDAEIRHQAADIILGQTRLVIATLSIEEINQDREKFLELVNVNVGTELQKIGLEVINVNIRDITDESGYIEAIGQKAAAEAINQAKIEVAQAEKVGLTGEAEAVREREVSVSQERARSDEGQKAAERDRRVAVAAMEAEAITGENMSKAKMAEVDAELAMREATAKQSAEVARANAERDIFEAQKAEEMARLAKEQIAQQEIERQKVEIEADAKAEQIRRVAAGEADAILARQTAIAEGEKRILEAKADGYRELIAACDGNTELAPTLLMIEKIQEVVAEQVKAISNLKIDKITVWDGGRGGASGGQSGTAGFLSGLMGSLPPMHELARQAGISLPEFLGKVNDDHEADDGATEEPLSRIEEPPPIA